MRENHQAAFPCPIERYSEGFSKREWYACVALQGYMSGMLRPGQAIDRPVTHRDLAQSAFLMADAMIEEAAELEPIILTDEKLDYYAELFVDYWQREAAESPIPPADFETWLARKCGLRPVTNSILPKRNMDFVGVLRKLWQRRATE